MKITPNEPCHNFDVIDVNKIEAKARLSVASSKKGTNDVWMCSNTSSFILLDINQEATPRIDKNLTDIEEEIKDLCAKVQNDFDAMKGRKSDV